jgi:hypothetical protein
MINENENIHFFFHDGCRGFRSWHPTAQELERPVTLRQCHLLQRIPGTRSRRPPMMKLESLCAPLFDNSYRSTTCARPHAPFPRTKPIASAARAPRTKPTTVITKRSRLMSPNCWSASAVPSPGRVPERGCELALKGMPAHPSPPAGTGPEQRPTSWGHEPRSQWRFRQDGSRKWTRSATKRFPRTKPIPVRTCSVPKPLAPRAGGRSPNEANWEGRMDRRGINRR